MDNLLPSFSLSFLLRNLFSGVFLVLSFCLVTNTTIASENIFSIGLPSALISGVMVYGIHRSLIYPLFEWGLNADWAKAWRQQKRRRLISENAIRNLVNRWDAMAKDNNVEQSRFKQISIWADYIHLQFNSAWCIVFGCIPGFGHCDLSSLLTLLSLAFVFLCAALVSNWRSLSVEEHWPPIKNKQATESGTAG